MDACAVPGLEHGKQLAVQDVALYFAAVEGPEGVQLSANLQHNLDLRLRLGGLGILLVQLRLQQNVGHDFGVRQHELLSQALLESDQEDEGHLADFAAEANGDFGG